MEITIDNRHANVALVALRALITKLESQPYKEVAEKIENTNAAISAIQRAQNNALSLGGVSA